MDGEAISDCDHRTHEDIPMENAVASQDRRRRTENRMVGWQRLDGELRRELFFGSIFMHQGTPDSLEQTEPG